MSNPSALLFIAGQIAADSDGSTVGEGDVGTQTRQVFFNIGHVLDDAGLTFRDVVKFTTYIVGAGQVAGFADERVAIFPQIFGDGPFPPNTLIVIDRLARSSPRGVRK